LFVGRIHPPVKSTDMFILVCRYNRVFAYPGDDVTLTSHLSPETSAVTMEIRWFRGIECIYQYKKGQVTVAKAYAGRVSLLTQELEIGNVSLILREVGPGDTGIYVCQIITRDNKLEKSIHLYMAGEGEIIVLFPSFFLFSLKMGCLSCSE
uniref:Ig-like domain-containing protein n=1 Tax=Electrophorus electricus TaxID=8005 RepID=A0A4W4EZ91_ELEEL